MIIKTTRHAKQQLAIRLPREEETWLEDMFTYLVRCWKSKVNFIYEGKEYKVYRYPSKQNGWKIGAYKFWFIYSKNYEEYIIITFFLKEDPFYINGKRFNLNCSTKLSILVDNE